MNDFECTNELMEKVSNQTEAFLVCLDCKYNLVCPMISIKYDEAKCVDYTVEVIGNIFDNPELLEVK